MFALLAALAFLQYRWAGELSTAELVRLRAVAHGRVREFARAFDREITRMFLTFVVRTDDAGVGKWQSVVARIATGHRIRRTPSYIVGPGGELMPELLREIFVKDAAALILAAIEKDETRPAVYDLVDPRR